MDLEEYWQENKRFVLGVVGGALVFLIAYSIVGSTFAGDIRAKGAEIARLRRDLAQPMLSSSDLADARDENDALRAAVAELIEHTGFRPRPEFVLDPGRGAANTQYLRALSDVREELLLRANRQNLRLEPELGMPSLSPTREAEIVRYLEALDAIDSTVDLALRARAKRVEKIQVKLDPGLTSREGLGDVERTRVSFTVTGDSLALTRLLTWTQRPPSGGRPLCIEEVELLPSRAKTDEVRLDLTLVLPRVAASAHPDAEEEGA